VIAISRALGDWEYKKVGVKPEDNMVSGERRKIWLTTK
jgi:hypothetical protein